MDQLSGMAVFAKVVETKSFSGAAQALRLSKSSVSKQVSKLEDNLGARLLNRTTRRLSLTEVGLAYYERVRRILEDIEEAERCVSVLQDEPRGTLRLSAPVTFATRHLSQAISDYMTLYPEIDIDMTLNDRIVDVVEEGFDLAIRSGVLSDSSLIARKIATTKLVIAASSDFWTRHGQPEHPTDLKNYNCLIYSYLKDGPGVWRFNQPDGKSFTIQVSGNMRVNNGDIMLNAACNGLGIAMLPSFIAAKEIASGKLICCLEDYTTEKLGVFAVYPHSRHLSAKVRSFVDFLAERFDGDETWLHHQNMTNTQ